MIRSKLLLAWRARFARREDLALQRFCKLETVRNSPPAKTVPVFLARKASLT